MIDDVHYKRLRFTTVSRVEVGELFRWRNRTHKKIDRFRDQQGAINALLWCDGDQWEYAWVPPWFEVWVIEVDD